MPWPFSKKKPTTPTRPHKSPYFDADYPRLSYWLYFNEEEPAQAAAQRLSSLGLQADADISAQGKDWLVLAYGPIPDSREDAARLTEGVRAVAASLGGEFDGWEAGSITPELGQRLQEWDAVGVFATR